MKGKRPSPFGKRAAKEKPAAPESMEAEVTRTLSAADLYERSKRLARAVNELDAHKEHKRQLNRDVNGKIKQSEAEVSKLAQEIRDGFELVPQGDLFADETEAQRGAPPKDQAAGTLAEIEQRTSPAAQFIATLGERNGMDEQAMKRRLWDWCADKGIRGKDAREALWLGVQEIVAQPAAATPAPADGPQATA